MHKDIIDALAWSIGSKAALARKLTDIAGQSVTSRMISNWRHSGVSWRFRGAFEQLAAENGIELPSDFLISDTALTPSRK